MTPGVRGETPDLVPVPSLGILATHVSETSLEGVEETLELLDAAAGQQLQLQSAGEGGKCLWVHFGVF